MAAILCRSNGDKPELLLKNKVGSVKSPDVIEYLEDLKKHVGKRKLLFIWDGLPAHRSKLVNNYLKKQKKWLKVIRYPAYAPELNPPEYLWSAMKGKDLSGLRPEGCRGLIKAVEKSRKRIENDRQLLKGFLAASKLFDYSI